MTPWTGAHVDEAASGSEGVHGQGHGVGDGLPLLSHRLGHHPVLGVDEIGDLQG